MSKSKSKKQETNEPAFLSELNDKGYAVVSADTIEALATIIDDLPADVHYAVGAVSRNNVTGQYSIRIDISK